jgi:5-methylthioadenosine/S-adenosylhomocysteine deaminase
LRIYHARWLLPVSAPPVEHGTVAVDGRRIAYVGPRASAPHGEARDLGDVVVMPGLVDAHTHLELTAMRGLLDAVPYWRRPDLLARARAATVLTDDALLDAARLGVVEGLRGGVTTFADSSASGVSLRAMAEAGVRGIMYQEVHGPAPEDRAPALASLRASVERLRAAETDLARLGVAPYSTYLVDEDLLVDACAYALGERLPICVHLAQSAAEIDFLREGAGEIAHMLRARGVAVERRSFSPVHLFRELGVADVARPLLAHCVALDATDVSFIAESGCPVVVCPASDVEPGNGVAPLAELIEAGVAVGVGTDVPGDARLAGPLRSLRAGDFGAVSAAESLALATLGGARALGLDDRVGSLEAGKEADLAAFPLDLDRVTLASDPTTAALSLAGTDATFVTVAGVVRVDRGAVLALDPALESRVRRSADAVGAWAAV